MPQTHEPQFPLAGFLPEAGEPGTVHEPDREVPIIARCDVMVAGGGPSGVCAAAAAARAGAEVLLVERHGMLGGMVTAGGVNLLHSLYGTDQRTRIIGGLPEEFIRRLQALGAARNAAEDGETAHWVVCAETARFVLDDMVIGSGCRLLLHTWVSAVAREGRSLTCAFVEGKSGRGAILAKTFIDCTGDADLIRRAGCETQLGDPRGGCQPPSLCFRVAGAKPGAVGLHEVQARLFGQPMDYNGERYPTFLWGSQGLWDPSEHMMAGTRVVNVNAADTLSMTRAEVEGRYQLRWVLEQLRGMPGWEDAYLVAIAPQIGTRESHRILADHQLTREEVLYGVRFPAAIAQGTYPIDIHTPDGPGISFSRLDGTTHTIGGDRSTTSSRWDGLPEDAPKRDTLCYFVPYGSLIPRELDNVLAAGRCIGANHDSAGAIRVMMNCMQFGQAAGVAAAMAAQSGQVRDVDPAALRARLVEMGEPLIGD